MHDEGPGPSHAGTRWTVLRDAVAGAASALGAPLTEDALERGWTEELRSSIVQAIEHLGEALSDEEPMSLSLAIDWDAADAIVQDGADERWDAMVGVEYLLEELDRVDLVTAALHRLGDDLAEPLSRSDLDSGFDVDAQRQFSDAAAALLTQLDAGEYLSADGVARWESLTSAYGMTRLSSDQTRNVSEVGMVDGYPKGRRWDSIVLCDTVLHDLSRTDLDVEDEQTEA
jgi:hypothetical protein